MRIYVSERKHVEIKNTSFIHFEIIFSFRWLKKGELEFAQNEIGLFFFPKIFVQAC